MQALSIRPTPQSSSKVKVIDTLPNDTHEEIIYPAGVISSSKEKEKAKKFYAYLQSDRSLKYLKSMVLRE